MQSITTGEITREMDLPPGPIVEVCSRAVEKSRVFLTSFLKLPLIKDFKFSLAVGLGIERTVSPSQNNNGLTPLPTIYTLRDDNLYRLSLQSRHTKAVKAYDAEIEIYIWNEAAAEVFHVGYMAKPHDPIFQHLRNIISKHFKRNVCLDCRLSL